MDKNSFVIILSAVLVLVATLPFDNLSLQNTPRELSVLLLKSTKFSDLDMAVNVFLFVPFGIALGNGLNDRFKRRLDLSLAWVTIVGFALSYLVELLQAFSTTRMPSTFDVIGNTIGTCLGFIGYRVYASDNPLSIIFVYAAVAIGVSLVLQRNASLSNWELSYRLVLGNERTGDRPWRGRIFEGHVFDRALAEETVVGDPREGIDILTSVPWHVKDRQGEKADAIGEQRARVVSLAKGAVTGPNQWFESATPVGPLSQKLKKSSQFSLTTRVATDDLTQTGPARIISLSHDPDNRNFTLAQDRRDLVFRLRTPITGNNGAHPELRIREVFTDLRPRRIAIIYDGSSLTSYVDGARRSPDLMFSPGYVALSYLSIQKLINVDMNVARALYYLAVFVPMGMLIKSTLKYVVDLRTRYNAAWLMVLVAVGLELTLVAASGKPFEYTNVALALLCAGGVFVIGQFQQARKVLQEKPLD
jgi:glycopeptide antibiotics resistance protein